MILRRNDTMTLLTLYAIFGQASAIPAYPVPNRMQAPFSPLAQRGFTLYRGCGKTAQPLEINRQCLSIRQPVDC